MKITEAQLRKIIRRTIKESVLHREDLSYADRDLEYISRLRRGEDLPPGVRHELVPSSEHYWGELINDEEYKKPILDAREQMILRKIKDINSLKKISHKKYRHAVNTFGSEKYSKYYKYFKSKGFILNY